MELDHRHQKTIQNPFHRNSYYSDQANDMEVFTPLQYQEDSLSGAILHEVCSINTHIHLIMPPYKLEKNIISYGILMVYSYNLLITNQPLTI